MFIELETPTGDIDGVNKEFTLVNNINSIVLVYFGGAPYVDYTFTDNVLTLADAPPIDCTDFKVSYYSSEPAHNSDVLSISAFKTLWETIENDTISNNTLLFYWLNEIDQIMYSKLYKIYPEKYIKSMTISVVNGTQNYALPNDFLNINLLSTGLFNVNSNVEITQIFPETKYGSRPRGFYLNGTHIVITPIPNSDYELEFRYIPKRAMYTSLNNFLLLPKKHQKFYVDWFSYFFLVRQEDYQTAGVRRDFAKEAEAYILREFRPTVRPVIINSAYSLL